MSCFPPVRHRRPGSVPGVSDHRSGALRGPELGEARVFSPAVKKKYNRRQLSRIIIINMLKTALPMESICRILSYVNGQLDDESDEHHRRIA